MAKSNGRLEDAGPASGEGAKSMIEHLI
jgi:hypothetical protein